MAEFIIEIEPGTEALIQVSIAPGCAEGEDTTDGSLTVDCHAAFGPYWYGKGIDLAGDFGKLPFPGAGCVGAPMEYEVNESQHDFDFPQREAAFFYGLFLRGHSVDQLRRDIEVPPDVLARWNREAERQPAQREQFDRMLEYRRHVLAIFESLLSYDSKQQRLQ